MNDLKRWDPEAVLAFWFPRDSVTGRLTPLKHWFAKDPDFDAMLRASFGYLLDDVFRQGAAPVCVCARERLAGIVLLDQFTRNVFRDTPKAFAGDALARTLAVELLADGGDMSLEPLERVFAYLPFEHSESMADQDRAVALFDDLSRHGNEFTGYLEYAHRHRDVIRQFGRFPHRNRILGRVSTPAEIEYLARPGSGF
ncbi:DUF924 family protein [Cognatazoarcus halotolerans]|uniref:DUF924 family protein n=1 Tax=Cognatazoarcus halotolerans TaxID=2686016 RepID=UPI00190F7782|nr:DUF924 family protein [Cognatazoarcus halotolerans]MBX3680574.1 DUF924 domain-containing protein [Rhodocyclaceae bacterium]MCB1901043.1 DUF924 domain-containing protein [Rhodocyclaceae bacterium]